MSGPSLSSRIPWFAFFLRRSVRQRLPRVLIASLAVMLTVGVLVGLTGLSLGIREKLGEALKAYGANIIVSARDGGDLPVETLARIRGLPEVESAAGQLYGRVRLGGAELEAIGVEFGDLRARNWRLEGAWPERPDEFLLGVNLKTALGLEPGARIEIRAGRRSLAGRVAGFVERGGDEDNAVFLARDAAGRLLGRPDRISTVLVRSRGEPGPSVSALRAALPGLSIKTLRQVARAETSLLRKIQLLMALVSLVVVGASVVSVGSTMGATVLERREEIGLMKAIGGTRRSVGLFYTFEAALIGLIGGLAGIPAGVAAAELVSKGAFGSWVSVPWYLGAVAPVFGMAMAVVAGHFPVRDAMKPAASQILRGE